MMDLLGRCLVVTGFAILGFVANTLGWIIASQFATDPTVGGAYAAAALLTSVPATVVGALLGGYIVYRLENN